MATYQEALTNLQTGGLTGSALTQATASLNNAYGVGTPTATNFGASAPSATKPVSQTQDATAINNQMSGTSSTMTFPPPPAAPTTGISNNTGVPSPIPAPEDIINQGNTQTPAEQTNKTLLEKVASLIGSRKGQTTLTNEAEASAGVPALQKVVNDLNTQLEGLNNQALDLQNQARPGGAIQNQEQQNVLGRGVTAAGLAPISAGDLRKNQIQQSAIASQALTVKSAIYGAQGNLSLAKDAADKAAQAQYEEQQNQIDYQKALIEANLPQMNKEERNQALLVQTKLADRQTAIDNAKQDKQTIIGLAIAALKNNPNNPAAQYAAQQALALSNQQQPDLQAALGLVGKYQTDPLDTQLKIQQILNARLSNQKLSAELASGVPVDASSFNTGSPAANNSTAITKLIQSNKLTSPTKTGLASILGVINAASDLANQNPEGKFTGVFPGGGLLGGIAGALGIRSDTAIKNQGYLDAINLQVQQWASGASLTKQQIDQVNKLVPNVDDSDSQVRSKLNNLTNYMMTQAQSRLQSEGVTFVPQKVDFFAAGGSTSGTTVMTGPGGTFNVPNDQVANFKANGYH